MKILTWDPIIGNIATKDIANCLMSKPIVLGGTSVIVDEIYNHIHG